MIPERVKLEQEAATRTKAKELYETWKEERWALKETKNVPNKAQLAPSSRLQSPRGTRLLHHRPAASQGESTATNESNEQIHDTTIVP